MASMHDPMASAAPSDSRPAVSAWSALADPHRRAVVELSCERRDPLAKPGALLEPSRRFSYERLDALERHLNRGASKETATTHKEA